MMFYIINAEEILLDINKQYLLSIYPIHLARLQMLRNEGRLLAAGLIPTIDSNSDSNLENFIGLVIVAKFESLEIAKSWVEVDPYIGFNSKIYRKISVKPYKRIL